MKLFLVILVFSISLVLVLATLTDPEDKEKKALQECNATNPVERVPVIIVNYGIVAGERIKLSQEEKCNLFCYLQKIRFVDENAEIRGHGLVNYTLHTVPELSPYVDSLIAQVFQIKRLTKGIEDKCHKAFVSYHSHASNIFVLTLAKVLQDSTDIKDKVVNAVENGQQWDQAVAPKVHFFLSVFDKLIKSHAKRDLLQE